MLPENIVLEGISFPFNSCIIKETAVIHMNSTRLSAVVNSGVQQVDKRELL